MHRARCRPLLLDYEIAIHAIGQTSAERGIVDGPGLSIKLSTLRSRYSRLQRERVLPELLPRARFLALLAHSYDIGVNIDADGAERLDLSLEDLELLSGHRNCRSGTDWVLWSAY